MDISFGSAFGISEGDLYAHELRICGGNGVAAIQRRGMPLSTVLNFSSSLQILVSHESNPLAINVLTWNKECRVFQPQDRWIPVMEWFIIGIG